MVRLVLRRVVTASARGSRRACAGSLAAVLMLAGLSACGGTEPGDVQAAAPAPAVALRPEPQQLANFALLRTRPEGLPASVRAILRKPTLGMRWALAQRMPVDVPGDYWLVPGAGHLCIVNQTPASPGVGAVCATTAQVVSQGMATVAIPRRADLTPTGASRLIVGVAPDRARRVYVHTGRAVAAAPVLDGLFVRRDAATVPPDSLSLRR
jgi:hypothetical protein